MPGITAGLGILGFGVMLVVVVGTVAYSLLSEERPNYENYYSGRDNYSRGTTFNSDSPFTSTARNLKKKKQRVSLEFTESDLCSICNETVKNGKLAELPCHHCFHFDCIMDWLVIGFGSALGKGTCPMCRQNFASNDLKILEEIIAK